MALTPALQLLPFTLDPAGQFILAGTVPPHPVLTGLTAFMQAAAIDSSQPTGSALSNSVASKLRPPRVFIIDYGSHLQATSGSWCSYDALTDLVLVGPVLLPAPCVDAVFAPSLGWLVFLIDNGTIYTIECYDSTTGAPTASIPLPWWCTKLALEGNTLYLTAQLPGSPAGPPALASIALPSGTPGFFTTLASSPSGYGPQAIMIPPGSGHAYLRFFDHVAVVNLGTGVELPVIPATAGSPAHIQDWTLGGTTLFTLVQGGFGYPPILAAIDTTTHSLALPPVPLPLPPPVLRPRFGPGQFGNALFVQAPNMIPSLVQVSPTTLLPINHIAGIPGGFGDNDMTLSAGATEWLILTCSGPAPFGCPNSLLLSLQVPSMAVSTISPSIPPSQRLTSVPSATLRRAFWVLGNNLLVPFSTDPAGPPSSTVPVPVSSTNLRVLID